MDRSTIRGTLALTLAVALLPTGSATAATSSFAYTGAEQTFTVPAGVFKVSVVAVGGHGGASNGAFGARVSGELSVSPGQVLFVEVGGTGTQTTGGSSPGAFNGGGAGGTGAGAKHSGAGGGASDLRTASRLEGGSLSSRLIVAAGGGGGSGASAYGGGGGAAGAPGADGAGTQKGLGGGAGTLSDGGAGGGGGAPGAPGTLGGGGAGGTSGMVAAAGGGGGGGYYGGGGGGSGGTENFGGGGGGGSSFTGSATNASVAADTSGTPSIAITYTAAATGPGTGTPGSPLPPGAVDIVKPAVGSLSFSATTFKAASSGGAFSARKRRVPTGTRVSFTLSEPSAVRFTVQRKTSGRRVSRRCRTRTRKNRTKPKCTLWKNVTGSFTVPGKAGKNTFKFRGRIGGKKLRPASYRLNGTATDPAKNKSLPKRKRFRIVK